MLIALLFGAVTSTAYSQTFIGIASSSNDNTPQTGATVAINPAGVGTMQAGDLVQLENPPPLAVVMF
ncbi:MAG: hypothetical protein K2X48_09235 [Chitinophagaceae bacterium]|nr:hypothetical protein [Chitinophagaceae bacterium]